MTTQSEEVKSALAKMGEAFEAFKAEHREQLRKFEAKIQRGQLGLGGGGGEGSMADREETKEFLQWARSGLVERKGAMLSDDTAGGYTVPSLLAAQIAKVAAAYSPMRSLARVVQGVPSGFGFPVATSLPAEAWVSETATRAATATPSFAKVVPPSGELYANAAVTSFLLEDSAYSVDAFLIEELGRSQGSNEGAAFMTGTGINRPRGLAAETFVTTADATRAFGQLQYVASGSSGTFDIDDLIGLLYTLAPEYRAPGRAAWVMSPGALAAIRTQKASTGGSYMWEPSSQQGQPSTLLGCPVYEDSNVATPATDSLSVFVGDFQRGYVITDVGTPRLLRDPLTVKGSVLFYKAARIGGCVLDSNAIKALKLGSS